VKITAVIITHNEERNIGRCLDSIHDIVDEMLVVDSGSTDRTEEISSQKGARFLHHDWTGYSDQKNWANEQATGDYILSLDADEAFTPELAQSFGEAKSAGLSGLYGFNRLTNYCGTWIKHCGWYPDRKVRLFPKHTVQWEGSIHETLLNPQKLATRCSYYSREEHLARVVKYTQLNAERLDKLGRKGSLLKGRMSAISRFINMYFVKLGFLDGQAGYQVCRISAKAAFLKYKYLTERQTNG